AAGQLVHAIATLPCLGSSTSCQESPDEPVPKPAVLDRAGARGRTARPGAAAGSGLGAGPLPWHRLHDDRGFRAGDAAGGPGRAVADVAGSKPAVPRVARASRPQVARALA